MNNYKGLKYIKILKLTSDIPPSVNHYLAYRAIIKNGKPMAMSYKTSEANKYQTDFRKYVIQEAKKQGWEKSDNKYQHYYFDCTFYFPRIDMDCNNYFKCMLDAITNSEVVWIDDNQVCERINRIYYDNKNPRIEIEIKPVDYIGIFDNISHFEQFKDKCIQCKKYKDGKCSVFNKALENRIQDEVVNFECSKFVI